MKADRREFIGASAAAAVGLTIGCTAPTGPSPVPPSTVPRPSPSPAPAPSPSPAPQPSTPTSQYGTFYRSGRATINGTLEEVLRAAGLNPELNNIGLLVKVNGRSAPLVSGANPNNGCYFVHVNGRYVGNGSAREITLRVNDEWDLFDWNGRT